jgi:hypothetical protein
MRPRALGAANEALMLVAILEPSMFARIGIMEGIESPR